MVFDANIKTSKSLKFNRKLRRLRETGPRTISMSSPHAANKGSVNYSAMRLTYARYAASTHNACNKARRKRESKNKKQEAKRFSTFAVYRLRHSETNKKTLLDTRIMFKWNMCETANQQYI